MGTVGVIREFEYMRKLCLNYAFELKYYLLGDFVTNCSKLNYIRNFKPGYQLDQRTSELELHRVAELKTLQ